LAKVGPREQREGDVKARILILILDLAIFLKWKRLAAWAIKRHSGWR
jgi:hypothetical protein